jgi:hypothetical protein
MWRNVQLFCCVAASFSTCKLFVNRMLCGHANWDGRFPDMIGVNLCARLINEYERRCLATLGLRCHRDGVTNPCKEA